MKLSKRDTSQSSFSSTLNVHVDVVAVFSLSGSRVGQKRELADYSPGLKKGLYLGTQKDRVDRGQARSLEEREPALFSRRRVSKHVAAT